MGSGTGELLFLAVGRVKDTVCLASYHSPTSSLQKECEEIFKKVVKAARVKASPCEPNALAWDGRSLFVLLDAPQKLVFCLISAQLHFPVDRARDLIHQFAASLPDPLEYDTCAEFGLQRKLEHKMRGLVEHCEMGSIPEASLVHARSNPQVELPSASQNPPRRRCCWCPWSARGVQAEVELPSTSQRYDEVQRALAPLSEYHTVHVISTPWGGGGDAAKKAGAEKARETKERYTDVFAKEFTFNPNTELEKLASAAAMSPEKQGARWVQLWAEVARVAKQKGGNVFVMRHKRLGILGDGQHGEIAIARGMGFEECKRLVYIEYE